MANPNCTVCQGNGKFTNCFDFEYDCSCSEQDKGDRDMNNYNDGNWHVWQGNGECPIVDGVRGDITYADGEKITDVNLNFLPWSDPLMFRVTKAHREPREAYFAQLGAGAWLEVTPDHHKAVLFREVLD